MSNSGVTNDMINSFSAISALKPAAPVGTDAIEAQKESVTVFMLIGEIFHEILPRLAGETQVTNDKIELKKAAMDQINFLREELQDWNESVIGDQQQLQETEKILLTGVQIPQRAYGRCAYKIGLEDNAPIRYSDFPPKNYEDYKSPKTPGEGELVYEIAKNAYKVYTGGTLVDVSSPIPKTSVPGPDVDFGAEKVGSLIFVESSQKYYRVANDGSGVPVTDYPLQKFISNISDKGITDLDRVLEKKANAVRDLNKKDLLDLQTVSSLLQVFTTALTSSLTSLSAVSSNVIRNI